MGTTHHISMVVTLIMDSVIRKDAVLDMSKRKRMKSNTRTSVLKSSTRTNWRQRRRPARRRTSKDRAENSVGFHRECSHRECSSQSKGNPGFRITI